MTGVAPQGPLYISDETARALIDEQFPQFSNEELGRRYTLTDSLALRIGDHYGAIFPRLPGEDEYFARATQAVAPLVDSWSFPSSHPISTGVPSQGYPYHWVIVPWISASTSSFVPLHETAARPLGEALRQIHVSAPPHAPVNPHTGTGLASLRGEFDGLVQFARERGAPENRVLDASLARAVFEAGASIDEAVKPTWTHGRLEPRAILSDRGNFAGILLWQYFGAGDPAADLGQAANLIPLDARDEFWRGYGAIDTPTATRANAYQVLAALSYIEIDDPFMMRIAWERLIELELAREA